MMSNVINICIILLIFITYCCSLRSIRSKYRSLLTIKAHETTSKPSNPIYFNKQLSKTIEKTLILGLTSIMVNKQISRALDFVMPDCSDSITVLKNAEGSTEIVIIGTAHISEESANLVRSTIKKVKPDIVMIELDVNRIGSLRNSNSSFLAKSGFIIPSLDDSSSLNSQNYIQNHIQDSTIETSNAKPQKKELNNFASSLKQFVTDSAGKLLGNTLKQFYKSVEKLGFKAGGEFEAAIEEAKLINAKVLLGDRDVNLTLQRLATAIGLTDPKQLVVIHQSFFIYLL